MGYKKKSICPNRVFTQFKWIMPLELHCGNKYPDTPSVPKKNSGILPHMAECLFHAQSFIRPRCSSVLLW